MDKTELCLAGRPRKPLTPAVCSLAMGSTSRAVGCYIPQVGLGRLLGAVSWKESVPGV